MKLLLDSNVIVAAFASRGLCQSLFELCVKRHEIVLCEQILSEVERVLTRKIKLPAGYSAEIAAYLRETCDVLPDVIPSKSICADPTDDSIIEFAAGQKAEYLITGDSAMLEAGEYGGVKIVSPRGFWEIEAER
ncbi:MAG: putative toxin-antitoxin system toxin component, PIN family [Spirochaetes bacterium GWF1_51_8]|nr:MAG: putative toxin-antitoxin system toxin component, PIN family [Spirochaetes bacterium GWF1_51_8]